jgi:hypothetical protein
MDCCGFLPGTIFLATAANRLRSEVARSVAFAIEVEGGDGED